MYMCWRCGDLFEEPVVYRDDPSPEGVSLPSGADNTKYSDGKKDAAMADMDKPITKAHIKVLKAKDYGLKLDPKVFGKDSIEELTEGDYGKALNDLAKLNR